MIELPGVALLINKSYLFSEVHLNIPLQAVAAKMTLNKVVTFCSIYLPPSDHVAKTDLINLIEQLLSPFVLLGDFNGHSPVWGNESYNSRGLVTPNRGVTVEVAQKNERRWQLFD